MGYIFLLLTLLFPFLYKYSFVITNQFSQIPIILSFMDPKYLTNDWYVAVNRTFGPRTIYAFYMAQLAKVLTLPIAFFLNYLLYIFLITYSSYRLTYLIFKNRFIAFTTALAIIFGTSITLGGNILVTADLSAPQLPLSMTLLAIVWLIEEKYLLSSFLFAAASFLHPLIGFESAALFFSSFFIILLRFKKSVIPFIKGTILPYFLLTLPASILYLKEFSTRMVSNIDKINILAYMRNPHHFVASTFPLSHFIQFFIFLTLYIIFSMSLKRRFAKSAFILDFIAITSILIFLGCIVGYFATEIIKYYPLVALQTFRLTVYFYWLGAIIIFGSSLYFVIHYKDRYSFLFLLPILLSNITIFYLSGKIRIITMILFFFLLLFFRKISKKIIVFILIIYFSLFRFHEKFNFSLYAYYPSEETALALWANKNTPSDTIFMIPPEFEQFRLIANRAVVIDWKSFPFQETAMIEWANRICDIGGIKKCNYGEITRDEIILGYRSLSDSVILKLAEKYRVKYLISDVNYPLFNKIYRGRFNVYKL